MPAPTSQEVAPSSPHLNADAFPVGNKAPEAQLPSFLSALEREGPLKKGLLGWEVGERLPWGEEFGYWCQRSWSRSGPVSSEGVPSSAGERRPFSRPRPFAEEGELDTSQIWLSTSTPTTAPAPLSQGRVKGTSTLPDPLQALNPNSYHSSSSLRYTMDSAAKDKVQPTLLPGSSCPRPEWAEQERAEQLARGAALKWASGIFYRPEQLARLAQYRSREVQRNHSLEARIKSVVQSYLEGVQTGVWQLARALEAVQGTRGALSQAQHLLRGLSQTSQMLEPLRERVAQHKQLQVLTRLLPRLQAVPAAVAHTQTLIDAQRFLEAYVSLRELEQLQEETWTPLGGQELPIFQGLGLLAEALGQAVEAAAGAAGRLAREDPALLVAAVRVAEVETERTILGQAPRDWRQRCLRALQEGLERAHFASPALPEPGALAGWLEALQVALPAELAKAEALVAPCCPPNYHVVRLWAHTLHSGLRRRVQQLLSGPELGAADTFALLHWALHVYMGKEMMGNLELGPEADVSQLEPLLTSENIEQLEAAFVAQVQLSVAQWLKKALDGEVAEWSREQEPNTDPSGFYHSPMPAIVLQILAENIRVASLIGDSLHGRVHDMALSELGAFLRSFSDALIRFSRDHLRGEAVAPHYVPYLLAAFNHQSALRSSVSVLLPDGEASGFLTPVEAALDEVQRRVCRLVLEALQVELQPLFAALPSRRWLLSSELLDGVCEQTSHFCQDFWRVRKPAVQLLLAEAERTVVLQYLRSLMQGRLVCRGADERTQAAERLRQDAAQLKELFLGLGLEESAHCAPVLLALRELLNLHDPTLLGLEVAGLRQQFPDVSEDHVSALLDLRGDVSREHRQAALSSLQAGPPPSPSTGRRALFSLVPTPTPSLSSCLPSGPCS